jgi:hypothetical protein
MSLTSDYYLEVNGVPLDTHAWMVLEGGYDDLLNSPQLRGADVVMPQARGRRTYPRIVDATPVSISMLIIGEVDEDGVPMADPLDGLFIHRDYLRDNLGIAEDADPTTGTVVATWVRGTTLPALAGEVVVVGLFDFATMAGGFATVRLDLILAEGGFTEGGS